MISTPELKIRQMTVADHDQVTDWCNIEGWNLSRSNIEAYFESDPESYFVGEIDGKVVCSVSATRFGECATMDLYLVDPVHRGKGYGWAIFSHALNHLKDVKYVGLHSVPEQVATYEKSGFKLFERIPRMSRIAERMPSSDNLVDLRKIPIEKLEEYDRPYFGSSRLNFLKAILAKEDTLALGYLKDGELRGYGMLRKQNVGYRISPMVVEDSKIAEDIINGLQSLVVGEEVSMDVYEKSKEVLQILEDQKWNHIFDFYKMFLRGPSNLDTKKACAPVVELG